MVWGNIGTYRVSYNTMFRIKEIETFKKVGIDKETYLILKKQKRKLKKSMMRIVKDLIIEKYGDVSVQQMLK